MPISPARKTRRLNQIPVYDRSSAAFKLPKKYDNTNIAEAIVNFVPGYDQATARDENMTVAESLGKVLPILAEAFDLDPLSEIGHLCDTQMTKSINLGMSTQKLGLAAYCLNYALYGETQNRKPLIKKLDSNPHSYYNRVVLPSANLIVDMRCKSCSNRENKFSTTDIMTKEFDKWSLTLHARQEFPIWSSEYLLSDNVPRNSKGKVHKDMVKGIYFPMHRLLFMATEKYVRRFRSNGNYVTPEQENYFVIQGLDRSKFFGREMPADSNPVMTRVSRDP